MRARTDVSEIALFEPHDRVVSRMPTPPLEAAGASFRLEGPGRPHRLVGRLQATRFEGTWSRRRRTGSWRVDVVPASTFGVLLTVVVEDWRGRDDVSAELARRVRTLLEDPGPAAPAPTPRPRVRPVPVWDTAAS